ncbi:MAG: polysaccharide deacetylase family protein [candidate division FCPU426 bacterium]
MSAPFAWPQGARAALSLTYDDSLSSHLDTAIPQLRARGFAGTFFLNPGLPRFLERKADWLKMAEGEQELANHTFTHPCSKVLSWVPKGQGLEDLDEAAMRSEIDLGNRGIRELGIKEIPSFAYPCGQSFYEQDCRSYVPMVRERHLVARGVAEGIADPWSLDLMDVAAYDGSMGAAFSLDLARKAVERGHWLVLLFHGVGAEHLTIATNEHAVLLDGLKAMGGALWVAPFGEVGKYISSSRS